jgi:PAS domain S-box-containing protein
LRAALAVDNARLYEEARKEITERKRIEAALKERAEELVRSNAELEQFAYVASHDLQEPLRMVSSYTQLLARRYKDKLDADEFIGYAVDGANRMQTLINDPLAYSHVGTRGKELTPTHTAGAFDAACANLRRAIKECGADVTSGKFPTVMGDETQLVQLFQNLNLSLPNSGGLETVYRIRTVVPGVPVVVLSGQADESIALQALQSGAQDYLIKGQGDGNLIPRSIRYAIEPQRADEALRQNEERFRSLVQNASDVITILDADGTIRYDSPAIERVLGYEQEERVGKPTFEYVHPGDVERVRGHFARPLQQPGVRPPLEFRIRHKDGSWRDVEVTRANLLDDPAVRGVVVNSRDVTERKRLAEQLQHQAFYDHLTGLVNRALFMDRLGHALTRLTRRDVSVAVLFA